MPLVLVLAMVPVVPTVALVLVLAMAEAAMAAVAIPLQGRERCMTEPDDEGVPFSAEMLLAPNARSAIADSRQHG